MITRRDANIDAPRRSPGFTSDSFLWGWTCSKWKRMLPITGDSSSLINHLYRPRFVSNIKAKVFGAKSLVNFIPARSLASGSSFILVFFSVARWKERGEQIVRAQWAWIFVCVYFAVQWIPLNFFHRHDPSFFHKSSKFFLTFANSREWESSPNANGRRCIHVTLSFSGHVPQSRLTTFIFSRCNVLPSQARLLASHSIIVLIHIFLRFVSRHCILFTSGPSRVSSWAHYHSQTLHPLLLTPLGFVCNRISLSVQRIIPRKLCVNACFFVVFFLS